jgi:hypothetical protein
LVKIRKTLIQAGGESSVMRTLMYMIIHTMTTYQT